MASLEFNKIAGALLGSALVVMGLRIVAEGVFATERPAKPGYELAAASEEHAAAGAPAAKAEPLGALLAKADVKKGEGLAAECVTCHSFDKGGKAKAGPPLYGVVQRAAASVDGFSYSDALKAKGGKWSIETLNEWLANPKAYADGTKMSFKEADATRRANILAYLNSLSDSPAPLPK